jgi:hypothetical protein
MKPPVEFEMNERYPVFGVYRDRNLCFAFEKKPGPIIGVLGGVVTIHPEVSGKIHNLGDQSRILEYLQGPNLEETLRTAGFEVLTTPRAELEWALS